MNENVHNLKNSKIELANDELLTNFDQWNIEVGVTIANQHNIKLTYTHWDVISWIQEQFKAKKEITAEAIYKTGIVTINELKTLFTNDPITVSTKIAGLPDLTGLKQSA
ncbi:MAG: TusE/DsrC/DsvC family sulfur relay protein [Flavobacteriales bacterium]